MNVEISGLILLKKFNLELEIRPRRKLKLRLGQLPDGRDFDRDAVDA